MKVAFKDGEKALDDFVRRSKPGVSISEAFPLLGKECSGGGLAGPFEVLRCGLIANWIAVHLTGVPLTEEFNGNLVGRSLEARALDPDGHFADFHEAFLQCFCYFFNRNDRSREANINKTQGTYSSLADLIYRLRIGSTEVIDSLIQEACDLPGSDYGPDVRLVRACLLGDALASARSVKRVENKWWKMAGREGIFYPSGDDEVAIEFSARGRRHSVIYFWPWFDCCFASHALKNGIDIKTDNLWMPEELLLSKGA